MDKESLPRITIKDCDDAADLLWQYIFEYADAYKSNDKYEMDSAKELISMQLIEVGNLAYFRGIQYVRATASQYSKQCVECERVFDLTKTDDANEWRYGHDCED